MNTDRLTTIFGGLYGLDQLATAVQRFAEQPNVENAIHILGAIAICVWAYFTNRHVEAHP